MKKTTKACLSVAAVAAAVAASALVVFAWGPTRPTYTMAKPADHNTFNSITDNNKEVGDERYFVSASEYFGDGNKNQWSDTTMVENGKEYVVRMYVHNDAAANLGLVANNTKAYVVLPTETATSITVNGKISSPDANPTSVWDQTTFKSKNGEKFNLAYVKGTAKYYNTKDGKLRTFNMDTANNDLFTDKGMLLGYDQMDGKFPGCIQYSGYLTFHVKAQFAEKPDLEVTKEVKIDGTKEWGEQVKAKSGDTVRYRIHVKNTGNTTLKTVIVRDLLPDSLTYVKGTTTVQNSNAPKGAIVDDSIVSKKGLNIGDYAPGAGAWIYFNATVNKDVSERCENSILRNVVQATGGYKVEEDTADVLVDAKVCKDPEPTPEHPNFTIDKTVQNQGGKDWSENVKTDAGQNVRYRIQFKNTGDVELKNVVVRDILPAGVSFVKDSTVLHNAKAPQGRKMNDDLFTKNGLNIGDYKPGEEATIYFYATIGNDYKDKCEESLLTNTAKAKYNNDDKTEKSDTAKVTVNAIECKDPVVPPVTPPTPPELPKTGAENIIMSFVGAASVITASAYYIASRKK